MNTIRAAALLCVLALLPFNSAFAGIYEANDPTVAVPSGQFVMGFGNVTIAGDLAWLDLSLTRGMTLVDAEALYAGYHLATESQAQGLLVAAGMHVGSDEQSAAIGVFQMMYGISYSQQASADVLPQLVTNMMLVTEGGKANESRECSVSNSLAGGALDSVSFNLVVLGIDYTADDRAMIKTASYALVRPASEVPEPSSLVLASLGLLGAIGMMRVQRRRQASAPRS